MELLLRQWRAEDAFALQRCADDREIACFLRDVFPHPYVLSDAEYFIKACLQEPKEEGLHYAVEVDGALVGSIGLCVGKDVACRSAELGYWLARVQWGRGIVTEAVTRMCHAGFEQLDLLRIFAEPFSSNTASRRVLEKNGFVLEGVLQHSVYKWGQVMDACVYALLRP